MNWIARFFPALSGFRLHRRRSRRTVVIANVRFGMVRRDACLEGARAGTAGQARRS